MTDTTVRDLFIKSVRSYAADGANSVPLSDWYETTNGDHSGFQARPVVGGHLAHVSHSCAFLWHVTATDYATIHSLRSDGIQQEEALSHGMDMDVLPSSVLLAWTGRRPYHVYDTRRMS